MSGRRRGGERERPLRLAIDGESTPRGLARDPGAPSTFGVSPFRGDGQRARPLHRAGLVLTGKELIMRLSLPRTAVLGTAAIAALGLATACLDAGHDGGDVDTGAAGDAVHVTATSTLARSAALGVSLRHPASWRVEADDHLSPSFGFTLYAPDADAAHRGAFHGGERLGLRVAVRRDLGAADLDRQIDARLLGVKGIAIERSRIEVAGHRAEVLAGYPGITETTLVYVPVGDALYELTYGEARLDAAADAMLASIRFEAPPAIETLGLPTEDELLARRRALAPLAVASEVDRRAPAAGVAIAPGRPRAAVQPGCADQPSWLDVQVQWDRNANGGTGASRAGSSYYGEGGHVNCNSALRLNDYYALDHALPAWDRVFAPGAGTVLYAGLARGGWSGSGIIVVIDLGSGYWHQSLHLSAVNVSAGQRVDQNTVIGWVGATGNTTGNHLHQGMYRNASLQVADGGVYGGQSVRPTRTRYFHDGGGFYAGFAWRQEIRY
jgi:hypothetical protein